MVTTKKKRAAPKRASAPSASDEAAALWELCEEHAGRLPELEATVGAAMGVGTEVAPDAAPSVASGDIPALYAIYYKLSASIDPALREYFTELVKKGAKKPAAHKSNTPGALCFTGVCLGDWKRYEAFVIERLGSIDALEPARRLELEVCARRLLESGDDRGGLPFMRRQIERWIEATDAPSESMASLPFLLRRKDKAALALVRAHRATLERHASWPRLRALLGG